MTDLRDLVSIFPQAGSDKIFQTIPLASVTVTNADTPVFGGYEQVVTISHNYGNLPNLVLEASEDQVFWYPVQFGAKTYNTTFNLYMFIFATRWEATTTTVSITFFANTTVVPKTVYYRGVLYANL